MQGMITEIQRFSVHDGPGIRTTVFLKGCNMRCAWCHNPETLVSTPQIQFFPNKCIGCGECFRVCPSAAHQMREDGRDFERENCQGCGVCAKGCFAEALVSVGQQRSVEEIMNEVLQDREFYKNSAGGMTISGGEPLVQAEFTAALLKKAKEEGLHTALESNVSLPWEKLAAVLPLTDLVMLDIKSFHEEVHRQWTGISNQRVLENARRLSASDKPIIVRTPVIPGINDHEEDIGQIAKFISTFPNLLYYELLPYHPLGTGKYESLGMKYRLEGVKQPEKETMSRLVKAAREHGIEVKSANS